jgi:hypothetical protein
MVTADSQLKAALKVPVKAHQKAHRRGSRIAYSRAYSKAFSMACLKPSVSAPLIALRVAQGKGHDIASGITAASFAVVTASSSV